MIYLNELGAVCSLGNTKQQIFDALINQPDNEYLSQWHKAIDSDKQFYCGVASVTEAELISAEKLAEKYRSRNNQLAHFAYQQIKNTFNELTAKVEPQRIAIIVGTSTSGIKEGESARACLHETGDWPISYEYQVQEMGSPAQYLAALTGAQGPVYSISTACSSSAKALASGKALLAADLVDVVIAGGVDTLSDLPNNGFNSLESIAGQYCNPLGDGRDGINIGEAAALFVMSKTSSPIALLGTGESSDAHHISAPHPEGDGAVASIQKALNDAKLTALDINYVNLHGTATPKNDEMESKAVASIFGDKVPCSSTKRFTGHTLGAAGAIEAAILWLLLSELNINNAIPKNKSDLTIDPALANIKVSTGEQLNQLNYCLSNSFAFGGNNISIILGKNT